MTAHCKDEGFRCSQIGSTGGMECCGYLLASGEIKLIDSSGNINAECPLGEKNIDSVKRINFEKFMEIVDGYRCRGCKVNIGEGCRPHNCNGWKNLNNTINKGE